MPIPERISRWMPHFVAAGAKWNTDHLLIAAICERESLGGNALTPKGPAGTGDYGHGRGLMQIDDRSWGNWLATHDWRDPAINIDKGAEILSSYFWAIGDEHAAVAAYNAGPARAKIVLFSAKSASDDEKIRLLDGITTGKNYLSAVLKIRQDFAIP